jgi:prolyl oligopeptidase
MFLTHRKGLKLDGANPVMLRGYGGFNSPVTPAFTPQGAVWLEMGGILADPALRGGGEYGSEWHRTGTKARKQNVFDDFIAAAEFLIAKKYTNAKKIAISGASNGGLLVAACLLQRPDLFGVALPAVGVLDMLRFHKFTIGWAWVSDYGSPDNPEDFKYLLAYSPLHNVKKGVQYPATLITTADHDDRVVPAHSFKFASALQAAQEGNAPILVRVQTKAGHGAGKPLSMSLDESADLYAFTAYHLGLSVHR